MSRSPRLFVVGRSELGALPRPSVPSVQSPDGGRTAGIQYPPIPPVFSVTLQSRERASLPPMTIEVPRELFDELPIGTEVELVVRAVRS